MIKYEWCNDDDNDKRKMMFDRYVQCENKLWIINKKKQKKKNMWEQIHVTHDTQTKIIVILTIKYTMK